MQDKEFAAILQDEPMQPLALVPLTEEEQVRGEHALRGNQDTGAQGFHPRATGPEFQNTFWRLTKGVSHIPDVWLSPFSTSALHRGISPCL